MFRGPAEVQLLRKRWLDHQVTKIIKEHNVNKQDYHKSRDGGNSDTVK